MHIAAAEPRFVTREEVPADALEKEREIARAQAMNDPKNASKPDQVIDKIVEGRLNKLYEESVLLEQIFVIDGETKVSKVIENAGKQMGAPIEFTGFARLELGEGVERNENED